jgi:hypothetical protein
MSRKARAKPWKNKGVQALFNHLIRILKLGSDALYMYVRKEYDLGRVRQIEKYYPGNYGAPGRPRAPKRKRTPEDIERQNKTNREKRVQRLIIANFKEGDWHLILSYMKDKRPGSFAEAKKQLQRFLDAMRRIYKKAGYEFKYIYVTERGKQGACHHHLIIEDIPELNTTRLVAKKWKYGRPTFNPLYEEGEFESLAEYIVKKETKEEQEGCSYSRSRNLVMPEPKREIIHRKRWRSEPKAPRGWYVDKNSLINGENPVTGYPYQHYTIKRLDPGGGSS